MFEQQRVPDRQLRAAHTEETARVYVACAPSAAEAALSTRRFAGPAWLTPSFRLIGHHCGYGSEPGRERVLALDLPRAGFESLLAGARPGWQPERDLDRTPLNFQALGFEVDDIGEIAELTDVTAVLRDISGLLATDQLHKAVKLVPHEPEYPLPPALAEALDAR